MTDPTPLERYRNNLQGEYDSAGLYRALAQSEPDAHLSEVYRRLAAVEEAHAEFWRAQLAQVGAKAGSLRLGWRTRAMAWLARRFGAQFVLPAISNLEQRDSTQYDQQAEAVAGGLPQAERSHKRIVQAIVGSIPGGLSGGALAQLEGRHLRGGNALRAAVLGANDGLVSNLSLVMGAAGGGVGQRHHFRGRPRRARRRRMLDGDRRVAVGDKLARDESAPDRHRGRRVQARPGGREAKS